jgi:hypothetical protein
VRRRKASVREEKGLIRLWEEGRHQLGKKRIHQTVRRKNASVREEKVHLTVRRRNTSVREEKVHQTMGKGIASGRKEKVH